MALVMWRCLKDGSRVRVLGRQDEIVEHKAAIPSQLRLFRSPRLRHFTLTRSGHRQPRNSDMVHLTNTPRLAHLVTQVHHHHQFITLATPQGTLCHLNTFKMFPLPGGIRMMNNYCVDSPLELAALCFVFLYNRLSHNVRNVIGLLFP